MAKAWAQAPCVMDAAERGPKRQVFCYGFLEMLYELSKDPTTAKHKISSSSDPADETAVVEADASAVEQGHADFVAEWNEHLMHAGGAFATEQPGAGRMYRLPRWRRLLARAGVNPSAIASAMPFAGVLLKQEQDLGALNRQKARGW